MSKYYRKINDPECFRANVISKLNAIINNQNYSENFEKGIYNYTLKVCEEKNLLKKKSSLAKTRPNFIVRASPCECESSLRLLPA